MGMVPLTAFSRYEYIDSITFLENSYQTLRTNGGLIPNDRFLADLLLEFRGRLTMPGATGPTAVQADAQAGIIERVTIEGYHRQRRQQEKFIDLRGSDLELQQRIYAPGVYVKTPTTLSVTASATNDIVCQILVPFTPLRMPVGVQSGYLLDAPNYESLKMTIQWGDYKSVVVAGTTPPTWSAYGSASGSPELRVSGGFAIHPTRFANFVPGRIFRYFQEITGTIPTTTATGVRIWDVPRGFDIRGLFFRSGIKSTVATAGNNAFASHSDFLNDIRINLGLGKYIRRYMNGDAVYSDLVSSYNLQARLPGINPIDFAQYGSPGEVLNTRGLISGPNGNVDLYLQADVAGAANQAIVAQLEEWRYRPIQAR